VRQGLDELGLPAADTAIRRRVAYRASALEGKSVHELGSRGRDASEEIHQLIYEVIV
jgi:chromosome partitioning protein